MLPRAGGDFVFGLEALLKRLTFFDGFSGVGLQFALNLSAARAEAFLGGFARGGLLLANLLVGFALSLGECFGGLALRLFNCFLLACWRCSNASASACSVSSNAAFIFFL